MENNHYQGLRDALIGMLGDFERAKKKSERAVNCARAIGGPLEKETVALMDKFDKMAQECLKLEQETREI